MNHWSFQLYSARNTHNLDDVFGLLRAAGYRQVEGYGALYEMPEQLKAKLDQYQLSMPTGHFDYSLLTEDLPKALHIAQTLGIHTIVCPYLAPEQRPVDKSGWQAIGQTLEHIRSQTIQQGIELAWHNHDFELEPLEDGTMPMDVLLESGPSIKWEMDVAWVSKGNADPVHWLQRYQDRLCAVHLKDIAPAGSCLDEDGWADLTHGVLPWQQYWTLVQDSPATVFVMEHDNPNDLSRFASRSIQGAQQMAYNHQEERV